MSAAERDPSGELTGEAQAIAQRYARRSGQDPRYALTQVAALMAWQERQRALTRQFARLGWHDLSALRLHEVGCGQGANLLEALLLGFLPENLSGTELLQQRHEIARSRLPTAVQLWRGDAVKLGPPSQSVDVVLQSTVFSSILDARAQADLASAMWASVRPGGGVLWYDFVVNNPRNPDVRGVPLKRVRELFPEGVLRAERLTLAPPLARAVCRVHPGLYGLFNALPQLRTHRLVWIEKRQSAA
jgi:hypothetical protein